MAWWNRLGEKILDFFVPERRLPERKQRRQRKKEREQTERKIPKERVERETPKEREYDVALSKLRKEQQTKRELERVMFNESLPIERRKDALEEYNRVTGWWRPTNNNEWSNDEWQRWEQIYESEPEVF